MSKLLKWICGIVVPDSTRIEDLYPPTHPLEYIKLKASLLDTRRVADLSYEDYEHDLSLYTKTFDDLFYHIDTAMKYIGSQQDPDDIVMLESRSLITLIEYRHGCNRVYDTFTQLLDILIYKAISLSDKIMRQPDSQQPYYLKRWYYVIADLGTLINTLHERKHTNT